eukprot:CAMPEP_0113469406 /NCGR_PEP_ID=MMETSP0014_2-20120614/15881_1 /TAXON_ID=2857 /ORGANISM="Nitzschia sp." /LENGTH=446 /DNA_ID=CAMNT_0000361879 /DNA_START=411 /DNA_END=1754 /DNA_ORIENTATION=+ /assembly_acc=CAM_ASM_000159
MMIVEAFRFGSLPSRSRRQPSHQHFRRLCWFSGQRMTISSPSFSPTTTSTVRDMSTSSAMSTIDTSKTKTNKIASTTTPIPSTVSVEEITIPLMDGMTIAGQRYRYKNINSTNRETMKQQPKQTILALHGWLDNCRSFYYLAPHLVDRLEGKAELVAIDLPGHGWSSHKSLDGPPMVLSEALFYVKEAIDKLGWNNSPSSKSSSTSKITNADNDGSNSDVDGDREVSSSAKLTLLGHSMGGGIAMAYSAVYPYQVDKLVMIDVYGPLPGQVDKTCSLMKAHIESRQHGQKTHRAYPSIEKAIQARRITASKAPGKQSLSLEAATEMVRRATEPIQASSGGERNKDKSDGQVQFRHDTRLVWPSIQYLMPEQVDELTKSVDCPTCIIAGDSGWPFKQERVDKALSFLENEHHVLEGSHHLHADPGSRGDVLDIVHDFLVEEKRNYVV